MKCPKCGADMREELAALMHEIWAGWANHMLQHHANISWRRKWSRQMGTPYDELSEGEKDSDRREADKVLRLLLDYPREELESALIDEDDHRKR